MSNDRQTFSDRDSINLSWIAYDGRLFMDDDVLDSMLCGEDGMVAEAYVYVQEFMRNAPTTTLRDI